MATAPRRGSSKGTSLTASVTALLRVPGGAELRGFGVRERLITLTAHARQGPGITRYAPLAKQKTEGLMAYSRSAIAGPARRRLYPQYRASVSVSCVPAPVFLNRARLIPPVVISQVSKNFDKTGIDERTHSALGIQSALG